MRHSRGGKHGELLSWSSLESPLPTTQLQRVSAVDGRKQVAPPAMGNSEDELELRKEIRTLSKLTAARQQSSEENKSLLSEIKRPPTSGQVASEGDVVLNIGDRQGVGEKKVVLDINFMGSPKPPAHSAPIAHVRSKRLDGMNAKEIQSELSHQDQEIKSLLKATRALTADVHQRSRLTNHPESLSELGSFVNFRRTRSSRRERSKTEADKRLEAKMRESQENQSWARLIQGLEKGQLSPRAHSAEGHLAPKKLGQRLAARRDDQEQETHQGQQDQGQDQEQVQERSRLKPVPEAAAPSPSPAPAVAVAAAAEEVQEDRAVAMHQPPAGAVPRRSPVAVAPLPHASAAAHVLRHLEAATKPAGKVVHVVHVVEAVRPPPYARQAVHTATPANVGGAGGGVAAVRARSDAEVRGYMPVSQVQVPVRAVEAARAAPERQRAPSIQGQAMSEMGQLFDAAGEGREARAVTAPLRRGAMRHAARAASGVGGVGGVGGGGSGADTSAQSEIGRMEADAGDAETMQVTGSINDLLGSALQRRLGRRDVLQNAYGADARRAGPVDSGTGAPRAGTGANGAGFRTESAEQREFADLENVAGESFSRLAHERSSQAYLGGMS